MKRFFLLLQLLLPILAFAQSNFKKGYIITNTADTVAGFIDQREQANNPVTINFKTTLNGNTQVYGLKDIQAFEADGVGSFRKYTVNISLSRTNSADLSIGLDTASKTETVFLKVLQSGSNITLFSYQDNIKLRYYVLAQGDTRPVELIRNVYYDPQNNSIILTKNRYINQIQELLRKFNLDMSDRELQNLKFYNGDLIRTAALINHSQQEKSKISSTRFFAGAGVTVSQAGYSGNNELNTGTNGSTSVMPMVNIGLDVFFNPSVKRLIFRTELSYFNGKYSLSASSAEATRALITHQFNQSVVSLSPQLLYNFYNTDKIKVFGGLGLGLNFAAYNKNERTRFNALNGETFNMEEIRLEKFYFSFPVNVGLTLNNKVEFLLGASLPETISDYNDFNVKVTRYRAGVRYLFGKK